MEAETVLVILVTSVADAAVAASISKYLLPRAIKTLKKDLRFLDRRSFSSLNYILHGV